MKIPYKDTCFTCHKDAWLRINEHNRIVYKCYFCGKEIPTSYTLSQALQDYPDLKNKPINFKRKYEFPEEYVYYFNSDPKDNKSK